MSTTNTVICTYRVQQGKEEQFLQLLRAHWPTLRSLALVTGQDAQLFRREEEGRTTFVEVFEWIDENAPGKAHADAAIQELWGPMAALTEEREGRPAMEFPHFERIPGLSG